MTFRRRLIRSLKVVALIAVVLTACSSGDDSVPSTTGPAPTDPAPTTTSTMTTTTTTTAAPRAR